MVGSSQGSQMINTKLPVSVVIIAKNEEKNLPRCLESVADWASEIVAVINDCHDQTESILKSYGAQIYQHEWRGYIQQKNYGLAQARQKWIFSMDADEEVTPALEAEIRRRVEDDGTYSAVSFRRKSYLLGRWIKHGDWYPDRVTRLFKNGQAKFVGDYQHEELVVEGQTVAASPNLLHYSYPTLYDFLKKTESFSRGFAIESVGKRKFSGVGALFRGLWKFFRAYILRLGFLDGFPGLFVAVHQSYATFFKYSILLEHEVAGRPLLREHEDKA